jgi:SAM-dependent methyltransferase
VTAPEIWSVGEAYEAYVGRWSRRVAVSFVDLLAVLPGRAWLDVGCGTGALTAAVPAADPVRVVGLDPSAAFVATARSGGHDRRVSFGVADARALPVRSRAFDAVVSGLAVNFVPEPQRAVAEFARVAVPGAVVAAYVWDYADGMAMMRHFWDAAVAVDPTARERAEGVRFPLCRPEPLRGLWESAGLYDVVVEAITIPMVFAGFDDLWTPLLGGQGPAPGHVASLAEPVRDRLREELRARLPAGPDGSIPLTARAWVVRGTAGW